MQLYTPTEFPGYELIDSGNKLKLERFSRYIFVRPETKALWKPTLKPEVWNDVHAVYKQSTSGRGGWVIKKKLPEDWTMEWQNLHFILKPTGFKHIGIFPEQATLWQWTADILKKVQRPIKVLNLFGYTGASTLVCAAHGASVVHLDASKDAVTWARINAQASGLKEKPIRWIHDDALAFVRREIRRGNTYDAVIMDPPKFGRGAQGEIWKIEDNLSLILNLTQQILSPNPLFFIITAYTVEYSSEILRNTLAQVLQKYEGTIENGELGLQQRSNNFILPLSVFTRWQSKQLE